MIDISPDTEEEAIEQEKPVSQEKSSDESSKKKVQTLTSILTAYSEETLIHDYMDSQPDI